MPAGQVDAILRPLPMTIVDADQALATFAGRLRAATAPAGLSPRRPRLPRTCPPRRARGADRRQAMAKCCRWGRSFDYQVKQKVFVVIVQGPREYPPYSARAAFFCKRHACSSGSV